jgi:uncharacterized membrane protein YhiD involved in acid resistance
MLVSVGAARFTLTSAYGFHDFLVQNGGGSIRTDPTRIPARIVTGTGAIIRQGSRAESGPT